MSGSNHQQKLFSDIQMRETSGMHGDQGLDSTQVQFKAVLLETEPRLRRYLSIIIRQPSDVDDIIQETFLIAWNRREYLLRSVPANSQFAWLCGVANHRLQLKNRSDYRHLRRWDTQENQFVLHGSKSYDQFLNSENRLSLLGYISKLSATDQMILLLTYWDDATVAEIAVLLNSSTAAAQKRIQRAIERLRKVYENDI
jgi:RNA polymerase sigma-70 factor (ECF subfamily)